MIPSDRGTGDRYDEWALVQFDGREETITMRLVSSRAFERAALIMPVPSRATFALGHDATFDGIADRPRRRVEHRERHVLCGAGGADDDGTAAGGAAGSVEVVDSQDLGPLRVVTLRAERPGTVETWLDDHGFPVPDGLEAAVAGYVERGWLIVAVRLRAEDEAPIERLQPLIVRFATDQAVYPMLSLGEGGAEARVDVLAPQPVAVRGWRAPDVNVGRRPGRIFAGVFTRGRYLTSFRFVAGAPGGPTGDLELVPTERRDFRQVRVIYEDVDITGRVLLAVLGGLAAIALVVVLLRRRRRA